MPSLRFTISQLNGVNDSKSLIRNIRSAMRVYSHLINALYQNIPALKDGEVFIETLSYKILLTSQSILQITRGSYVETHTKKATIKQLDFPSIHVLTRTLIETFLTLEYLFYNDVDHSERKFRFLVWQVSGYKSRQSFFTAEDRKIAKSKQVEKLDEELKEINKLLEQIKGFPQFTLSKHAQAKLDRHGIPRLKSWHELVHQSRLADALAVPYKVYSNYAHAEFISLIQSNGATTLNYGSYENDLHLKNALRVVLMINCTSMLLLKDKFASLSDEYNSLPSKQRDLIELWDHLAKKPNPSAKN